MAIKKVDMTDSIGRALTSKGKININIQIEQPVAPSPLPMPLPMPELVVKKKKKKKKKKTNSIGKLVALAKKNPRLWEYRPGLKE